MFKFFVALKSITLPETGPLKKSASFIATFVKESRNHISMTNTMLLKGEDIVRTSLLCIAGGIPRVNVDVFGDVFIALNSKYPSEFIVWMKILEAPAFPTTYVNQDEKINFMKAIIKYVKIDLMFSSCYLKFLIYSTEKRSTSVSYRITLSDLLQNVEV